MSRKLLSCVREAEAFVLIILTILPPLYITDSWKSLKSYMIPVSKSTNHRAISALQAEELHVASCEHGRFSRQTLSFPHDLLTSHDEPRIVQQQGCRRERWDVEQGRRAHCCGTECQMHWPSRVDPTMSVDSWCKNVLRSEDSTRVFMLHLRAAIARTRSTCVVWIQ